MFNSHGHNIFCRCAKLSLCLSKIPRKSKGYKRNTANLVCARAHYSRQQLHDTNKKENEMDCKAVLSGVARLSVMVGHNIIPCIHFIFTKCSLMHGLIYI